MHTLLHNGHVRGLTTHNHTVTIMQLLQNHRIMHHTRPHYCNQTTREHTAPCSVPTTKLFHFITVLIILCTKGINPLGSNVELRSTVHSLARGPTSSSTRHVILLCFLSFTRSSCHLLCAV